MYPDVAERAKPSIKEYNQFNPAMGGSRGSQGIQYGKGQTSSTTTRSMFAELRYQLSQSWNEEGFSSLYQALLICAMVEPYNLRSAQMACAADILKNDRENHKRGYEGQIEELQYTRYPSTSRGSSLAVNYCTLDVRVTSDRPSTP